MWLPSLAREYIHKLSNISSTHIDYIYKYICITHLATFPVAEKKHDEGISPVPGVTKLEHTSLSRVCLILFTGTETQNSCCLASELSTESLLLSIKETLALFCIWLSWVS